MKELSDVTLMVIGHGLDIEIARRLARDCKRVLYFSDWEEGFSIVQKAVIADGLDNVERCLDFWKVKKEIDGFVFPDIQHSGLQLELESQGYPVWGSRNADHLEMDRELFLEKLEELGLDVPEHTLCTGITELRRHLKDKEDQYVKISFYRGSLETRHWRNWKLDENWLDLLAVRFGAVRELIPFLVFPNIDTPLEIGGDTYGIDGRWPSTMLHGIESKDSAYLSAVTPRSEMPDKIQEILEAFQDYFRENRMRNEFSMEVRVKGDQAFFTDPTTRLGLPSTGSQLEVWENWSEIVWAGANGELVEPRPIAKFTCELVLKVKQECKLWPVVETPKEIRQWCKFFRFCQVEDVIAWPTDGDEDDIIGWLVAIGDTPREVLETIKGYVEELPEGISTDVAPLADIIEEIEMEEQRGIEFTDKPMPQPAEVIE